jgi:hypothetical protein
MKLPYVLARIQTKFHIVGWFILGSLQEIENRQKLKNKVNFCMYEKIAVISKQFYDISTIYPEAAGPSRMYIITFQTSQCHIQ